LYDEGYYQPVERDKMEKAVKEDGFEPFLISDPPGTTYLPHTHPETKLLAFLTGEMEINVQEKSFSCSPGDRLIIPGNVEHSALVGPEGCQFFWSEKLM